MNWGTIEQDITDYSISSQKAWDFHSTAISYQSPWLWQMPTKKLKSSDDNCTKQEVKSKSLTAVGGMRPSRVPWGHGLPDRYSMAPVMRGSMYIDWHPCSSGYTCKSSDRQRIK